MKPTWMRASTGLDVKTAMSASGRLSSFRTCTNTLATVKQTIECGFHIRVGRIYAWATSDIEDGRGQEHCGACPRLA